MPAPTYVTPDAVSAARAALAALEPPKLSKREAVDMMSADLKAARARGCTDRQILDVLAAHGIDMTESTLRSYLSERRPRVKPPRKGAAVEAAAALSSTQPDETPSTMTPEPPLPPAEPSRLHAAPPLLPLERGTAAFVPHSPQPLR